MNKFKTILNRIASSFFFWLCVAISFPIIVLTAHYMGTGINLNASSLIQIAKYFDEKLFSGIMAGAVLYILVIFGILKIQTSFNPKIKSTAVKDARDEISSQIIGIGSIIIVSNIAIFAARYISFLNIGHNDEISGVGSGLIFWIIGALAMI